jgi:hypothetical protein
MPLNLDTIQDTIERQNKTLQGKCDDDPAMAELNALLAIHKRLGDLIMIGLRTG